MSFRRRLTARTAAVAATVLVLGGFAAASPAAAAPSTVSGASLSWSLNDESGGGAFFGGCNFLSAGTAGNTGSARLWSQNDGFYAAQSGNVRIEKRAATGWEAPTWATKCKNSAGGNVTTQPGSTTGNRVVLSQGTGTIDTQAKTAELSWQGSFTVVYYGGLTYWSASNPVLRVNADGTARLSASLSGYGTSMEDMDKWEPIPARDVVLAEMSGVQLGASGLTSTPNYRGVHITTDAGEQVTTGDDWGSFPQPFVDFQQLTGQNSYWYSSGGAVDAKKVASPITVELAPVVPVEPVIEAPVFTTQPGSARVVVGASTTFRAEASGTDVGYRWQKASATGAWSDVSGQTGASLTVTPKAVAENGTRYRVVAANSGGTATATSAVASLTVTKATPTVAVSAPKTATFGKSATAKVTVSAPAGVAKATGTVTVKEGTKTVATAKVAAGAATVTLPKTLAVGARTLSYSFGGDANLAAKAASAKTTVAKAAASVTAKLAKSTITAKSKASVAVTVTASGTTPTGTVTATFQAPNGKKVTAKATLKNGKATIASPALTAKGKHTVTVAYAGSGTVSAKTSAKSTLTVK